MSGSGLEIPPDNGAPEQQAVEHDPLWDGPSGVIAVAGMIIAGVALWLFFRKGLYGGTDPLNPPPPNVLAVNISFCAMIMGVVSIFRIRRLSGQGLVRVAAVAALVMGMAGPFVFFWQGTHWRGQIEQQELRRVSKIAMAAREFEAAHGRFPPGLWPLLQAPAEKPWHLEPQDLLSPFRQGKTKALESVEALAETPTDAEREKVILEHSDYVYLGADLPGPNKKDWQKDARRLIVAASKRDDGLPFDERIEKLIPVGFGSGEAKYVPAWEMEKVLAESNKAREERGLRAMDERGGIQVK